MFRGHSTREPASSRVTYFILRAYTGSGVSHSRREKIARGFGKNADEWLVSWCFEPSQPQGITSGLKTTQVYLLVIHETNFQTFHIKISKQLFKNTSHKHYLNTSYFVKHTNLTQEIKNHFQNHVPKE